MDAYRKCENESHGVGRCICSLQIHKETVVRHCVLHVFAVVCMHCNFQSPLYQAESVK
ncbi:hypothetical protein glysoja_000546 [Glycine soja]|nr:hypothetical protein glysoja_000546 [Glycine soja]